MENEDFADLKQVSDKALKEVEANGTKKEEANADAKTSE